MKQLKIPQYAVRAALGQPAVPAVQGRLWDVQETSHTNLEAVGAEFGRHSGKLVEGTDSQVRPVQSIVPLWNIFERLINFLLSGKYHTGV